MLLVAKFTIVPNDRGMDENEAPEVTTAASDIKSIIKFGSGFIEIEYGDGSIERRSAGSISWRYHNPGNIKFGTFAKDSGAIGPADGGHAVFPNLQLGEEAMRKLVFSDVRGFNEKSILGMLRVYAPTDDGNDPVRYANFVSQAIGVSPNTIISKLTARQKADMITAMETAEGFKEGRIEKIQ